MPPLLKKGSARITTGLVRQETQNTMCCPVSWERMRRGDEKVLGYKYNGGANGDGWRCFLVSDFDAIVESNAPPPAVGAVNEATQLCIKNVDHT